MGVAATALGIRLSKDERREQLLNAAVEIVVERGPAALTMEGLAENAGVSKALPYQHFENAGAVLIAVYQREIGILGRAVVEAVEGITDPEDRVREAIDAYFDVVEQRGRILAVFSAAGSRVAAEADAGERTGVRFVSELLIAPFGLSGSRARTMASMLLGMLGGATESWAYGDGSRRTIQRAVTSAINGALGASQDA